MWDAFAVDRSSNIRTHAESVNLNHCTGTNRRVCAARAMVRKSRDRSPQHVYVRPASVRVANVHRFEMYVRCRNNAGLRALNVRCGVIAICVRARARELAAHFQFYINRYRIRIQYLPAIIDLYELFDGGRCAEWTQLDFTRLRACLCWSARA